MLADRRKYHRRMVHIPAKVDFGPDAPAQDCVVLDISEVGARLAIDGADDAPEEFTIVLAPCGRPYRRCRVIWRAVAQLGVLFDRSISSHTHPDTVPPVPGQDEGDHHG